MPVQAPSMHPCQKYTHRLVGGSRHIIMVILVVQIRKPKTGEFIAINMLYDGDLNLLSKLDQPIQKRAERNSHPRSVPRRL